MTFTEFLKLLPQQNDADVSSFLRWAKIQTDFPASSDPDSLAKALYKKLNHQMALGFQKCLMIYSSLPKNELPKELFKDEKKMLRALNRIIELQHADRDYKDSNSYK